MTLEQDKTQRILDSAAELFARLGYKKTSIDDIAGMAGVGKGTIYLMCESKGDLFYQVVHRELRAWVASITQLLDPRQPAGDLLLTCSAAAYRYIEDHPLVRDLMLGNHAELLPMWTGRLEDLKDAGRAHVREILRLGIRQGEFREDLDVEQVARLLQDMQALGLVLGYREKRSVEDQVAMGIVCLDMLLNGLRRRA